VENNYFLFIEVENGLLILMVMMREGMVIIKDVNIYG
jgi:hypothetical protein